MRWIPIGMALVMALLAIAPPAASHPRRTIRVCADPNDMPFSDEKLEGFENHLATLVAADLGADVAYTWWPQRRGFVRETLNAGKCDVVMGVPATYERVRTTRPYYRSGYAFVYGPSTPRVRSLDAPELRSLRIGVPLVGDDGASAPPVVALALRDLLTNLRGYSVYGDYSQANPAGDAVRALERGEVDIAIAWGPIAGGLARGASPPLLVALLPEVEAPAGSTFAFDIAMGVRKSDAALAAELDAVIVRRRRDIAGILTAYGVPQL
jgi:mxaJ protein